MESDRKLKEIEESIEKSKRLLKKMWLRVGNLDAQIQANQRNSESSKRLSKKPPAATSYEI